VVAFSAGAIIALLLMWGGKIAIAGLLILCVSMFVQSSLLHKKRAKKQHVVEQEYNAEKNSVIEQCKEDICSAFEQIIRIYSQTLKSLAMEDRRWLKNMYSESKDLYNREKERRTNEMLPMLRKLKEDAIDTGHYYVQILDYLSEVSKSLMSITKASYEYINNNHTGMSVKQVEDLENINTAVSEVYLRIADMLRTSDFADFEHILVMRDNLFNLFADKIKAQIKRVKDNESGSRNSMLYLDIVSETKTMLLQSRNLMRAQRLFLGYEEPNKKE
jgi:Na+/phosphate symporter